jgi:hypothetical protein
VQFFVGVFFPIEGASGGAHTYALSQVPPLQMMLMMMMLMVAADDDDAVHTARSGAWPRGRKEDGGCIWLSLSFQSSSASPLRVCKK